MKKWSSVESGFATNWLVLTLIIQGISSSTFGHKFLLSGKKSLDTRMSFAIPMFTKTPASFVSTTFTKPGFVDVIRGFSSVAQRRFFWSK